MSQWFLRGIKKGIKTEKNFKDKYKPYYPSKLEGKSDYNCPVNAIKNGEWDENKCIYCGKCDLNPTKDEKIYKINDAMPEMFKKSFYIYPLDSGTCGACNAEFNSIFYPQYDANRFKIFLSNTPRHADALLLMGVYTENMHDVIKNAYDAMPDPKVIIGFGSCALTGGIIGSSINEKFNVEIAGCPPSPYTIISAILKYKGDIK